MIGKTKPHKWRTRESEPSEVKLMSAAASRIKAVVINATLKAILLARCIIVCVLFVLCCLALPSASRAGSPTEQVRVTVGQGVDYCQKSKPEIEATDGRAAGQID